MKSSCLGVPRRYWFDCRRFSGTKARVLVLRGKPEAVLPQDTLAACQAPCGFGAVNSVDVSGYVGCVVRG
jgi:hypothetical protein